jgi:hypothetical protein
MTAINPPKQNTSGQFEVNFDGFTASAPLPKKLEAKIKVLTQSIVRARAAFRTKHAGRSPKVDVKEISTQLGIFSMWAKVDLNPEQLVLLIAQLEPGNTSTEITPDSTIIQSWLFT